MQLEPMFFLFDPSEEALQPRKVYIEPTSKCNLSCSICFRHGWFGETTGHMEWPVFEKLQAQICAMPCVEEVFFGGMGEPLFHPQICSMVEALSKNRKVSLLTNGTLLSAQIAENLIRAGISQLWISMDGFEKSAYEAIQIGSRFDRICRNIEAFNAARKATDVRLGITFVITPDNLEQLEKLNDFADWAAADEINLSHMIPNSPMPQEALLLDRADIPVGKMHRLGDFVQPHPEHKCPFIEQQATFVRWDGNVTPCMQMLHSCYTYLYEEKRKIQSFQYGNVAEKSLMDCWNDPAYAEFRFRVSTFYFPFCTVCFGCEDRKENQTDCFSGDGPTCGACLWSSGKVFCP